MTTEVAMHKGRRKGLLVGVLAVILLAIALGSYLLLRGDGDGSTDASQGNGTSVASDGGGAADESDDPSPTDDGDPTPAQPTSVEAPEPGATEPIEKPPTTAEIAIDEPATVAGDLVVEVVSIDAVEAGRDIPGETSGPAVKVVIAVENQGDAPVDTSGVSVNLTHGGDSLIPAPEVLDDDSSVLPQSIPAGGSGEGTFLFAVPLDSAGNVRIMVDVLASEPDVVFSGPRPE